MSLFDTALVMTNVSIQNWLISRANQRHGSLSIQPLPLNIFYPFSKHFFFINATIFVPLKKCEWKELCKYFSVDVSGKFVIDTCPEAYLERSRIFSKNCMLWIAPKHRFFISLKKNWLWSALNKLLKYAEKQIS